MASCTKTKVMVLVEKDGVELKLSNEEAQTLIDVLASVGGHPKDTRRCHTQSILKSLEAAGFDFAEITPERDYTGSILFLPQKYKATF